MEKTEKVSLFQKKIIDIYGDEVGKDVLEKMLQPLPVCFRVNTLKADINETLERLSDLGFKFSEGFIPNSFYPVSSPEGSLLSDSEHFNKGHIYIQNFSSMVPALILDPKPSEKILDLCASPGSKTTQIAALSGNRSYITAVENNVNRYNALKRNCEAQGVENIDFIRLGGQELSYKRPQYLNYFDKVLCDVPCSNEGLLRNLELASMQYWNTKNAKKLSLLQKKIMSSGIELLKDGGTLIYSTCTYSVEENEQVLDWALRKRPEMEIVKIDFEKAKTVVGLESFGGKVFSPNVAKSLRILPDKFFEGFFIAKLRKVPRH